MSLLKDSSIDTKQAKKQLIHIWRTLLKSSDKKNDKPQHLYVHSFYCFHGVEFSTKKVSGLKGEDSSFYPSSVGFPVTFFSSSD